MAHHSSVAIAGNAEDGQRSGGLGLDALDPALDQPVEGDLLAQHQLVNVSGVAAVDQLEQAIQLVGAGLQHLQSFVGLDCVGHHLAVAADQARQESLTDARLCSLVLDLLECDRFGLDVQRISHAAHNGCGILGLVARQVEGLIWHTGQALGSVGAWLANVGCRRRTLLNSGGDLVGQGLVSFWDQLKPASLGSVRQLAFQRTGCIWHQVALGFGGLAGDQLAQRGIDGASDLDAIFHAGCAGLGSQRHLAISALVSAGHGLKRDLVGWGAGRSARQDLA